MKLANDIINISEGNAFEVSSTSYNSNSDFKADEMNQLAKLLKLKKTKAPSYGYASYMLDGVKIDFTADRSKPVIVVMVSTNYEGRTRVKTLSSTQVKNLRKKIEKQIKDKADREDRGSKRNEIWSKLHKLGIVIDAYNKTVKVDGDELYLRTNGKYEPSGSIYYKGHTLSISSNATEKEIDKLLGNIKKGMMKEQKSRMKGVAKAEKYRAEIDKYMELSSK